MKIIKQIIDLFREEESNVPPLVIYNCPNIGPNGEITMSCVIHPSGRPHIPHTETEQDCYAGVVGIPSHCVAAIFIESSQYGLCFRWKPFNLHEKSFSSPFKSHLGGQTPGDPAKGGSENRGPSPLGDFK